MKIVLLFLFTSVLFASSYPTFTKEELHSIEKNSPISKNRIVDYQKHMRQFQKFSKAQQLVKVNSYLNQLQSQYDDIINHTDDSWATPKEFLRVGYGDCEDYVIIKYYSLIKLGFDEKKLFFTLGKEKFHHCCHMVLCYFKTKEDIPLVLDNLSFKILNLKQRKDLDARYLFNSTGFYKIDKNFQLTRMADRYKHFELLKAKIAKNL